MNNIEAVNKLGVGELIEMLAKTNKKVVIEDGKITYVEEKSVCELS